MVERICSKGNTLQFLVGMQTCTATLEISMVVSQKMGIDLPKGLSTKEWIKKMWYIYTVEYYSAIKAVFVFLGLGYLTWDDLS